MYCLLSIDCWDAGGICACKNNTDLGAGYTTPLQGARGHQIGGGTRQMRGVTTSALCAECNGKTNLLFCLKSWHLANAKRGDKSARGSPDRWNSNSENLLFHLKCRWHLGQGKVRRHVGALYLRVVFLHTAWRCRRRGGGR